MEHQNEHRMEVPNRRGVSRVEVLDGPTGRRRWPDDVKGRIVVESLQPGARVCDVATKYGLIARHLSQWRGLARQGKLVLRCGDGPAFVPLMVESENKVCLCGCTDLVKIGKAGMSSSQRWHVAQSSGLWAFRFSQ